MSQLNDYHQATTNWREQIRKNQRRSRWVVAIFILLYLLTGLLIDVLFRSLYIFAPYEVLLKALLTFQLFPYGTVTMVGVALIALWVTYVFSDKIMLLGTAHHEVTPETARNVTEQKLYNVVEEMKVAAGLRYMPKIYIIEADYMNAFASGYSEKSALVAITTGLLKKLNREELTAVMAHELSHIRHLDIKLTLTVGVLTNIMLLVVDILFYNILFSRNRRVDGRILILILVLRYGLPLVTLLLTLFLSRTREYMADAGCVELMRDNKPMASALMKIHQDHQASAEHYREEYAATAHEDVRRAAYLYDPVKAKIQPLKDITSLFSTHPTLEQRLRAIGYHRKK